MVLECDLIISIVDYYFLYGYHSFKIFYFLINYFLITLCVSVVDFPSHEWFLSRFIFGQ